MLLAEEGIRAMNENLVPIGRFSRVSRLSIKALRLYDELGLLPPAWVDSDSGYRYYHLRQVRDAQMIGLLRSLEMPLKDIRAFLSASAAAEQQRLLIHQREQIEARIAVYQHTLGTLERLMRNKEFDMTYDITIKQIEAQPFVRVRERTPQSRLSTIIPAAISEVYACLRAHHTPPAGPPVVAYPEGDEQLLVTISERSPMR